MNEASRKDMRARLDAQFHEDTPRGRAWGVWWKEHSHGEQHPDTWLPWNLFYAGFDAARTFSAEDVERVARVLANREMGDWEFYLGDARAALDVVGTVEEAQ